MKIAKGRIIKTAAVGVGALGLLVPLTTAASADAPTPITAHATIAQTLSVTGVNGSVDFGTVAPGSPATVSHAETFQVVTNNKNGATVSIVNGNDPGWINPLNITKKLAGYDSVKITTTTGDKTLAAGPGDSTVLEGAPQGSTNYDHAWTFSVPATVDAGLNIQASYSLAVVAN